MKDYKSEDVYAVGTHRYNFRAGEPALIIGVKMITPNKAESTILYPLEARLCYEVRYSDGEIDYIIISESDHKIISFNDIINGKIPKVTE